MTHPIIQGLMSLFSGYMHAHGIYSKNLQSQDGGPKLKGKAYSIAGEVTPELWEKHVSGEQPLGIIPIDERSMVKFAAIDVDTYPLNLVELTKRVNQHKLPLIPCRTKSGGAHLYLFLREHHDAAPIVKRMREFASLLGYGNAEIFPKQTKILPERGDIGQWINMPYFLAGKTDRFAIGVDNAPLSVSDFIKLAIGRSISALELLAQPVKESDVLTEGPPCLNHLVSMGFPEGTRNQGLFNLGVYAKKAHPDRWEAELERYNAEYLDPPLPASEVLGIMKSLRKGDFFYTCKQSPCCNFCNMPKCRTRKFGIGTASAGMPKFGSLTKLLTVPPVWFLEIEGGGRLELGTDDLQNQRRFQARCMDVLSIMPAAMKQSDWQEIIQGLLENVTIVEMPVESTPVGQLKQFLEDFCK
ncbi:hypothetical protein EPO05_06495, partial [Patescibacteria group bacterium]